MARLAVPFAVRSRTAILSFRARMRRASDEESAVRCLFLGAIFCPVDSQHKWPGSITRFCLVFSELAWSPSRAATPLVLGVCIQEPRFSWLFAKNKNPRPPKSSKNTFFNGLLHQANFDRFCLWKKDNLACSSTRSSLPCLRLRQFCAEAMPRDFILR
jgi:hypothetical protein